MNQKRDAIQFTMIFFLIVVLYLLGTRIHVNVGNVRESPDISEPPSTPPPLYSSHCHLHLRLKKKRRVY